MVPKKPKLTAAEKQRRYREKRRADAEREKAYKDKHKLRNAKRKKVEDMTEREKRSQRKMWKTWDKRRRQKKLAELLLPPTPPDENNLCSPLSSGNKVRGRRLMLKNKSKCVRDNNKLKDQVINLNLKLKNAQTKIEKYRKRLSRKQARENDRVRQTPENELTPLSKARKCLGSPFKSLKRKDAMKNKVVRTLIFHESLVKSLKEGYSSLKKKNYKRVVSTLLMSKYIRQYRLQGLASRTIGLAGRKRLVEIVHNKESKVKFEIESFFLSDDVSKHTAGMKETITRKKTKMQKRYLVTSMKKLYKRFLESRAFQDPGVSYKTFTRHRPFFVCKPSEVNRDTCLCKQHANVTFKTSKLKQLKLVRSENPHELYKDMTCNKNSVLCMYGKCVKCKAKTIPIAVVTDENEEVTWQKWDDVVVVKEKTKNGAKVKYNVKVASKINVTKPVKILIEEVQQDLKTFKIHAFNIKNQNNAYKTLHQNLSNREAILHIDFSENYSCKLAQEIQTYHFGASRDQATLHTGVLLVKGQKAIPFTSISASRDHNPAAIWAHLQPVLGSISTDYPNINTIHFFSDGPSTQYRQKKNFYLFSKLLFDMGFQCGTWNFFEASHGKGAPDGVGGALKRAANAQVAHGKDIPDAGILFSVLKEDSSVKLHLVNQAEIDEIDHDIPTDLKVVPGTRKIHQVATNRYGQIKYRPLSCFCQANNWLEGKLCNCLIPCKLYEFANLVGQSKNFPSTNIRASTSKTKSPTEKTKTLYSDIYSSSDSEIDQTVDYIDTEDEEMDLDEMICSTDPEANLPILEQPCPENIRNGVYILVKIVGGERKKTTYQYVAVCQTDLEDEDGEVKVMYLNVAGENATLFKTNENDISYIDYSQIIGVLPSPNIKLKGNRVFYKFPSTIDVYEQG